MKELMLTAFITTRKISDGFKVSVKIHCNKFTTGGRTYHGRVRFVGDIDHWTARVIAEVVSDIEGLHLHNAIRALEATHCAYKNMMFNLIKGNGFAVSTTQRPYYNSSVYRTVDVWPLIKTNKGSK